MKTAFRIQVGKRGKVRRWLEGKKTPGAISLFMGITEATKHIQLLDRHPEKIGIKDVLSDFSRSSQTNEGVISATKGWYWLAKSGIKVSSVKTGPGEIVLEAGVRITGGKPEPVIEAGLDNS